MAVDLEYFGVPPADYRQVENRNRLVASAGQTTFSAPYSVGYVDVWFKGVKLDPFSGFTATDGANIVLASAAAAGDILEVISRAQVQLTNTYTQQQVNALTSMYYGVCTGTGDAQTLVTVPTFTSFTDGMMIRCRAVGQNTTTTPTIAINGLAAKTVISNDGQAALYGKDWGTNNELTLRYVQAIDRLVLIDGGTTVQTASQFNNSNQIASTAFAQTVAGNLRQATVVVTGNTTLTTAQAGSLVNIDSTSSFTITLPNPATSKAGITYWLNNFGHNAVTLRTPTGSFNPYNISNPFNYLLAAGTSLVISNDGVNWVIYGGNGIASLGTAGYQRLPSGLIIQWGTYTTNGTQLGAVVFYPVAFPNSVYSVTVTAAAGDLTIGVFDCLANAPTTSFFTVTGVQIGASSNNLSSHTGYFVAIGR